MGDIKKRVFFGFYVVDNNEIKIKLYRSSTISLNLSGYKILIDLWLTDGEYYGPWSHYPYYDLDKNVF